jgi:two-component system, chemotaxis family, protein-glutamate methylesterase/glutaminase
VAVRDIIVLGASAGGIEAAVQVVHKLPAGLPAAVFVVMHFPPTATSLLPQILERAGTLPASHAVHGERFEHGHIYVARPDYHMVLELDGRIALSDGPRENGHRPSIDATMRSAALLYRDRVAGVVLSGLLDDGTAGLRYIKNAGGAAIVQEPSDALFDSMPRNAIDAISPEHVLPAAEIADVLDQLARGLDATRDAARKTSGPREVVMPTNQPLHASVADAPSARSGAS